MSDEQPAVKKPRTVDDLTLSEVGNNILTPLLMGLTHSTTGGRHNMAKMLKSGLPTDVPLGTPLRLTRSFPNGHMRERFRAEPWGGFDDEEIPEAKPTISDFTQGIDGIHKELVKTGGRMSMILVPESLPPILTQYPPYESFDGVTPSLPESPQDMLFFGMQEALNQNRQGVQDALTPENMKTFDVRLNVDGDERVFTLRNEPVGKEKKSMAHAMLALGYASETVGLASLGVREFMRDATGGFLETLPPLMNEITRKITTQLKEQGVQDPEKALRDSGFDIDRQKLREAFGKILPFADIYETASELRGSSDPLVVAFKQIRKAMGGAPAGESLECRDGYEYAVLIEGMADYAIAHGPKDQQAELRGLRAEFVREVQERLPAELKMNRKEELNFTPDTTELMALPQVDKILWAFRDAYAGQLLLDKDTKAADKAWAAKVTMVPKGEIIR